MHHRELRLINTFLHAISNSCMNGVKHIQDEFESAYMYMHTARSLLFHSCLMYTEFKRLQLCNERGSVGHFATASYKRYAANRNVYLFPGHWWYRRVVHML